MKKILLFCVLILGMMPASSCLAADSGAPAAFPSLLSGLRFTEPLEFCGEPVPISDQEARERLELEMLLTLWDRAQVLLWLKRSGRFFPIIESRLKSSGLPDDLKYVAVVESALRPHAGSVKGAIGFWQFIRDTGRKYGLTINSGVDERRNIFPSTEAAIRYFKKLYADTGSWTLSAAAYNMGENGLETAMKIQEHNDYYRLYLPLETQRYLFKIMAVKMIFSAPEKYGFDLDPSDYYPPMAFDQVTLRSKSETSIQSVALAAGTDYKRIKDLNPEIRGRYFPRGQRTILVPAGSGAGFHRRLAGVQKHHAPAATERIYIVRKGDSLSAIARRLNVPLSALIRWNGLRANQPIHPGDKLVIRK